MFFSMVRFVARDVLGSPPPTRAALARARVQALRGRSASQRVRAKRGPMITSASREGGKPRIRYAQFTPHPNPPPQGGREFTEIAARVVAILFFAFVSLCGSYSNVSAQAPQFTPSDEAPENFPAGAGRDETFYTCTACHNFKLVAAQGMSRRQWDDSLAWMVQKHGMPVLDEKDKKVVLDYLETAFPQRAAPGGFQNPFLKQ